MNKPRVIKDYEKLEDAVKEQIKLEYPYGFDRRLITFPDSKGKYVSALPFETTDRFYLVRMTPAIARQIVQNDEDYDSSGVLKNSVKEEYEEKYEKQDDIVFDEKEKVKEHPDSDETVRYPIS